MSVPIFSLAGRTVIITGGRRGIGKDIAITFAEAGADVAICDIVVEDGELEAVRKKIQSLGRRSLAIQTDISKKTDVDTLIKKTMDEFGRIDILVNNATLRHTRTPLLELTEEEWDRLIDICLKGFFLCSQAVGKIMVQQKSGNIINMASTMGISVGPRKGNAYSIAKAGVIMLTRVLAKDLAQYNIRVNAIAPSTIRTEATRNHWSDPEYMKKLIDSSPLGRLGETKDIVDAALFLVCDTSNYITGHTIAVDGGLLA